MFMNLEDLYFYLYSGDLFQSIKIQLQLKYSENIKTLLQFNNPMLRINLANNFHNNSVTIDISI